MNIEISTERLGQDISRFQEQLGELVAAKDHVYRCLDELNTMWEGTANIVFAAQTRIDRANFQDLIDELATLAECLENAKARYEQCASEVDERIAMIRVANSD